MSCRLGTKKCVSALKIAHFQYFPLIFFKKYLKKYAHPTINWHLTGRIFFNFNNHLKKPGLFPASLIIDLSDALRHDLSRVAICWKTKNLEAVLFVFSYVPQHVRLTLWYPLWNLHIFSASACLKNSVILGVFQKGQSCWKLLVGPWNVQLFCIYSIVWARVDAKKFGFFSQISAWFSINFDSIF